MTRLQWLLLLKRSRIFFLNNLKKEHQKLRICLRISAIWISLGQCSLPLVLISSFQSLLLIPFPSPNFFPFHPNFLHEMFVFAIYFFIPAIHIRITVWFTSLCLLQSYVNLLAAEHNEHFAVCYTCTLTTFVNMSTLVETTASWPLYGFGLPPFQWTFIGSVLVHPQWAFL